MKKHESWRSTWSRSAADPATTDSEHGLSQMLFFNVKQQRFHLKKPKFCWSTLNWCCLATRTRCCCGAVRWLSARCSQGLVRVCAFRYGDFEISDGKTLWEGEDQEIVFVRSACFVEVRFVGSVKLVSEFVYAFVFKVF